MCIRDRDTGRPLILVVPSEQAAARCVQDLSALLPGGVMAFPAREVSFLRTAASSRELNMGRLHALGLAVTGRLSALVVPADALLHRLMPRQVFEKNVIRVREGERRDPASLMDALIAAGYERVDVTEARGQCALRGGILDVYPVGEPNALRIEFFDDEIDSIRSFDVMTQRSISPREQARIFPAGEVLPVGEECLRAARELEYLLHSRTGALEAGDRQKQIEKEFDLMPVEDFLQLAYQESGEDELPDMDGLFQAPARKARPAKKEKSRPKPKLPAGQIRSGVERNFRGVLDALETGRRVDGFEALVPVLLKYTDTAAEYLEDPIVVFDQPERLRERCENRMLEFKEEFTAALKRDEALPAQGELLLPYDGLLSKLSNYTQLITTPFLRTEKDFRPKALIQPECRNATGYQRCV